MEQSPHLGLQQSTELRQQLVLAPQLRQSLELLQAPLLELSQLVRKELEQNPTLEEKVGEHEPIGPEEEMASREEPTQADADLAPLLELDESWREYFRQAEAAAGRPSQAEEERRQRWMETLVRPPSLADHLLGQLGLLELDDEERRIAELLIGNLDDDGFLNITLGELSETTGIPVERLEAVLRKVQELDPPGIGARDLVECLHLQLVRRGLEGSVADRIVQGHLEELARGRHLEIAAALKIPVAEVHQAARLIETLDPKPGRGFDPSPPPEVVPDVIVSRDGDRWVVTVNNEHLPRVRISRLYRKLLEDPSTPPETRQYIRDKIRNGWFLVRGIHHRQQTLKAIAEAIVEHQREFFERGPSALKPLTMGEIAQQLHVHETTVSRAVAGKYMDTPMGLIPMRDFFTTGYTLDDGAAVSNRAVQQAIVEMIEHEDPLHPLSDQAIAEALAAKGWRVARRTVAKYREELGIPPSHERRRG